MQKKVEELIEKYNIKCDSNTRFIDLVSEIGELGKELLKGSNYNKENFIITNDTKEEIGDCIFSLIALCSSLNIDANDALDKALNKYKKRFDEKGTISNK